MAMTQVKRRHPAQAQALRNGDMVICPDGRVGLLVDISIFSRSTVQFGTDGPHGSYDWKHLLRATMAQIKKAGLYGVGCNQASEG